MGMTDPTVSLRELAEIAATPAHARLILEFAERLAVQHNQQNNNWQVALGGTDLHLTTEIERLRTDVAEEIMRLRQDMTGGLQQLAEAIERLERALTDNDDASNAARTSNT